MPFATSRAKHGVAAVLACALPLSCGAAQQAPPVVTAVIATDVPAPGADPLSPSERLLALLTEDNPRIEEVAMSLASLGDKPSLWLAGRRLVGFARAAGDAQALERILAAMSHVGGPDVVDYAFGIAADESAPWDRRRVALQILDRVIDARDAALVDRRARVAARLPAPAPAVPSAPVDPVVARIRAAAKACFNRALQQDPSLQVTVHVEPGGKISGDHLPPDLVRCLAERVRRITAPGTGETGGQITVPIVFELGH